MDFLKNKYLIGLGILNVIFLVAAANAMVQGKRCIDVKRREEIQRFDAEQELNKMTSEKQVIEIKLKKLESDFALVSAEAAQAKKSLTQEQLVNQSLKSELEKIRKLKDALEQDLKSALITGKTEKAEKIKK